MTREGFSLLRFIVKWRRSRLGGRRTRPEPSPRVFYGINQAFVFDIVAAYRNEEFIDKSGKWSITRTRLRPGTVLIHPRESLDEAPRQNCASFRSPARLRNFVGGAACGCF